MMLLLALTIEKLYSFVYKHGWQLTYRLRMHKILPIQGPAQVQLRIEYPPLLVVLGGQS